MPPMHGATASPRSHAIWAVFSHSLQMRAIFTTGGATGWSRFAQLINKSNQFNLTTKRYTEAEIA